MSTLWKLFEGKVKNFRHTPDIDKFFLRDFTHKETFIDENCQGHHHPMPSCPAAPVSSSSLIVTSSRPSWSCKPAQLCFGESATSSPRWRQGYQFPDATINWARDKDVPVRSVLEVLHCHRRETYFMIALHYYEEMILSDTLSDVYLNVLNLLTLVKRVRQAQAPNQKFWRANYYGIQTYREVWGVWKTPQLNEGSWKILEAVSCVFENSVVAKASKISSWSLVLIGMFLKS